MTILISYSHRDRKLALILKRALESLGFELWMDQHELSFGDDIATRIRLAIAKSDFVLVIITPDSISSNWVQWEISTCIIDEQARQRTKLLPVLMAGDKVPSTVSGRLIADFRSDRSMTENFSKLVKQLIQAKPGFVARDIRPAGGDSESISSNIENVFQKNNSIQLVKAPIVGTVYLSPSPGAPPWIRIGSRVEKDEVLVLIEAMKLMNEIESPYRGIVTEIIVKDQQPVEYGEPLVAIETNHAV